MRKTLVFLSLVFCWISLANSAATNTPTPIPALYMYVPATGSPTWNPGLIRYRKNIPAHDVIGLTELMYTATPLPTNTLVPTNTPVPSNTPDDRWATITPVLPTYSQRQAMEQPGFTPNATDHYMCQTDRAFGGNLGVVEYTNPWMGTFDPGASPVTGTMKISLPVGYSAAATNYITIDFLLRHRPGARNGSFTKRTVSFSVYSSGVTNVAYSGIGGNIFTSSGFVPRVAYDGSKLCILLGATTTVWTVGNMYDVYIEKVKVNGNETTGWDNSSGYSVAIINSESGYTTSTSDTQYLAGTVLVGNNFISAGFVSANTYILSYGFVRSGTNWLWGNGRAITTSLSDAGVSTSMGRIDTTNGPITQTLYGIGDTGANSTYIFWKSSSDTNAVAFNSGATTVTFADGATTLMTNALVNQYDYIYFIRSYVTGLGASNGATIRWVVAARGNALTGEGFQYTPTPVWTYTPVPTATPHITVEWIETVQFLAQQTIDAHSTQIANQGTTQATHEVRIAELEKTATPVPTSTSIADLVASDSVTAGSGGIGTSGYLWTTLGLIGDISAGDRPITAEKGPEDFRAEEGNNRFYFVKAVNLASYPGSYAGVWGYSGEENGVYSYQICSTYADNLLRYRAVSQTAVTTWGPWRVVAMSDSPITFSDLTVSGGATFTTAVATQVTCDSVSSNYYISGGVTGITGSVTTLAPGGTTIISAYVGGLFAGITPVP